MKFVNRILMLPFCLMLLIGIFHPDFLYFGALTAFILGVFQLLSSLSTLFYFDSLDRHIKMYILIYLSAVILYFVGVFLSVKYLNEYRFKGVMYIIPIFLSLLWMFIIESIKKDEL